MASNRTFTQEISGNRQPNGELSLATRAAILTKLDEGQKPGKDSQGAKYLAAHGLLHEEKTGPTRHLGLDTPQRPAAEAYGFWEAIPSFASSPEPSHGLQCDP